MLRFTSLLVAALTTSLLCFGQQTKVSGVVKDQVSGETLISANVLYGESQGVVTDFDGKFSFTIPNGEYTIKASYIGYEAQEQKLSAKGGTVELVFSLKTVTMNEVRVVADMALDRETPVAFTNIEPKRIKEELASQDIPMLLNSTPGVYATQQGGGAGEARVTIRGFDQRNLSVMIDGIPMNDMENGWVYWSNWFGLDAVTQRIQVQRGLGASKLSIPAVGGSMNILTQGISSKAYRSVKLTVGNNGLIRTNVGYNSGRLKDGWGITAAFAYDRQDGYVEQTWASRFFYFVKIQKQLGNHMISVGAMGAPQSHGQRTGQQPIFMYDKKYARKLGAELDTTNYVNAMMASGLQGNYGRRFNPSWGTLSRNRHDPDARPEILNTNINYYHKPIINLRHFWAKDTWAVSNIVYGSLGNGGGTRARGGTTIDGTGHLDMDALYQDNITGTVFVPPFDTLAVNDTSQYKSTNYIQSSINNHYWYGLLTTVNKAFSKYWDLSFGVDARAFWVEHYSTPYDLLGGDYAVINPTANQNDLFDPSDNVKREGDIAGYRTSTNVYSGGLFAQLEYSRDKWAAFVSASGGYNYYIRQDQYRKKDLVLADTTYRQALGISDTIVRNGSTYTHQSPEAEDATTGGVDYWGGTAKAGVNYNINDHMNVFFNGGVFFRPPTVSNVYNGNFSFDFVQGIGNEFAWGTELGYSVRYPKWAANLNLYRTSWENKPLVTAVFVGGERLNVAVPGLGSIHQGAELDFAYNTPWYFDVEGLVSYGDWRWTGQSKAFYYDQATGIPVDSFDIDADGVLVGDAAQLQVAGSIKFKPAKGVYIKGRISFFDKHYANFSAISLQGDNKGRQSWRVPGYYTVDVHAGWTIKLKKMDVSIRASVINLLDELYISDATNNAYTQSFDATGASVYIGQGRRWTASVGVKF